MQPGEAEQRHSFIGVRYLSLTTFFMFLVLLVYHFSKYLTYAFSSIIYPFELDYGEGIIWQQALLIPGERMYGDINTYPFIVFHYTPLYHLAVKTIASLGIDYLVAGRGLSVLSTVAIAVLTFLLTVRAMTETKDRYIALLAGMAAMLTVFTYRPVLFWSPLMRVDMLAIALSFLGIYLAVRSIGRPALLYAAMLSFIAALYTKQTSLAAPVAASAVLLVAQPKQTMKAISVGLVVGLSALLYLSWETEGKFIKHILQYNTNPFSLARAVRVIGHRIVDHSIYVFVATITLYITWRSIFLKDIKLDNLRAIRERLVTNGNFLLLTVLTAYFILTSILLILVGKSGATVNYFIEWMCILSVIVGMAVGYSLQLVWRPGGGQPRYLKRVVGASLPVALMCSVLSTEAIAVLIFLLAVQAMTMTKERYIALLAGMAAMLTVCTYLPVLDWSPLLRVDMLAIGLSFLGMYLAVRSLGRPALLYGAMLSFVAALYTRQTSLVAPAVAASAVLLLAQPKQTMRAISVGLLVGLSALLYLSWQTEGKFVNHILQYNINQSSLAQAVLLIGKKEMVENLTYLLVAAITLYITWRWIFLKDIKVDNLTAIRERLVINGSFSLLTVLTVYLVVSSILLIFVGKNWSYVIGWMCIWSVIMGMAVGYASQLMWRAGDGQATYLLGAIGVGLPMALMCQVLFTPAPSSWLPSVAKQDMEELLEKIRAARKPVFSEDMVLLLKAGKEVPLEPAIFADLARMGQWDEQRFIELIRTRYFEFVVVTWGLQSPRYTSSMREAIKAAYRKEVKFGNYRLYLPSD
jgi:hypothetical protein